MTDNKIKINSDSQDLQIAKLAYIGSAISALGGGIQLIAAGLAIDVLENSNKQSSQSSQKQNEQSKQAENMQKQIDSIIKELKQIKRMMK
ncbi:translation initiation factor 2 [Lysinibacillus sp. NPDC097195]|uniref:translation initiation factor 2 n=1 Tax=Lysinibacillus sp. NPDC097195 TaxID=3364141 RepID=UPI00381EA683